MPRSWTHRKQLSTCTWHDRGGYAWCTTAPTCRTEAERELKCEIIHNTKYSRNKKRLTASNWSSRHTVHTVFPWTLCTLRLYQSGSVSEKKILSHHPLHFHKALGKENTCTHFHSNNIFHAQFLTLRTHAKRVDRTSQRMTANDKPFPFL